MSNEPNDVRVSRELLERMRQRLIELNQIADFGPELFEILNRRAQPADQQGKTERNQCDGCQAGIPIIRGCHRMGKPSGYSDLMSCTAKLYSHAQPATAKVVLPERRDEDPSQSDADYNSDCGWNACLDKVAKLNGGQT
ncbi:hypothetical protein B1F73_15080 [Pseudomonas syringae]|uniref:Uncharacterized protein n=1 Tax=Pseudomonas syringae TaxID=317 RepID=A0AB37ZPX6_PSESX|nr:MULTISPECIES: hypothetical protein [Pseudomonas]NAP01988.1 hypothetical protein [Pseudomonas syringae]NAP22511.1 hypothetical protein [Pseudomonas syringae]NAP48580.1 hypothetical protein [Pseudomonas syringae]NAP82566.1 hypothetical protein [Pseudomonas syringae]NAQ13471.1 hypothetical protein [Pseudomonas syringae]